MPKTKISEYSSTAGNNTDINSINIAEGCAPSGINDAIRTLMAQLKDWQSGAVSQDNSFNGAVTISGAAVLSSTLAVSGSQTNSGSLTVTGALNANGASSLGAATFSGNVVMSANLNSNALSDFTAIREKKVTMAGATVDLSLGNYFTTTLTTTTSFKLANTVAADKVNSWILDITNGGSKTITWFTGTKWAGGTAPTLTASGRDVLGFFSHDASSTVNGFVLATDIK
jgi:hypothetical protein